VINSNDLIKKMAAEEPSFIPSSQPTVLEEGSSSLAREKERQSDNYQITELI